MTNWRPWAQNRIYGQQATPWQTGSIASALTNRGTTLPSYQPTNAPTTVTPDYTPYSPQIGPTGPAPQAPTTPVTAPSTPAVATAPATPNVPAHQGTFITGPTAGTPYATTPASPYQNQGTNLGQINPVANGYNIQGAVWTPQGLLDPRAGYNTGSKTPQNLANYIAAQNTPQPSMGWYGGPLTVDNPITPTSNPLTTPMLPGQSTMQYALQQGLTPLQAGNFLASMMTGNG